MADGYDYWRDALAGKPVEVHDGDPQPGFYRAKRSKGGQFEPVAIWRDPNGQMVAVISGKPIRADDIWTWACRNPVAEAVYRDVAKGGSWPDADAAVTESLKPVDRHHNEPPDEMRIIDDQIDSALAGIDKYIEIRTDDELNAAQSLRARLNELSGQADAVRVNAKSPHLKAARQVDKLWMPLVEKAKEGADSVKRAMTAFLNAKIAAEKAVREEEGDLTAAPAPPPLPKVKGAHGRAATAEMVKVVSGITDIDALFGFLKEHPDLRKVMTDLAQRAVNKGLSPPGVRIVEEARIR